MKQTQFLEVLDRDEAEQRWRAVIDASPAGAEVVPLEQLLGRVLAEDVRAEVVEPTRFPRGRGFELLDRHQTRYVVLHR